MNNLKQLSLAAVLIATASSASAEIIYQESFEGGTLGPNTVLSGQGNVGDEAFFEILPSGSLNLAYTPTGADGTSYVGGRDLNANFGGQSGDSAERLVNITGVDISGFTDIVLKVALSARNGNRFEETDYIEISAGDGSLSSLDKFTGPAGASGVLSNGPVNLGVAFQDLSYTIADGITIDARVQAWVNGGGESLAIDNIRIEGTRIPEPASLALVGLGLAGVALRRRRGKGER